MLIQERISLKEATCFLVYVLILLASMAIHAEKSDEEVLLKQLGDPVFGEVSEDMAGKLWVHCRLDLIYKELVEDLDMLHTEKIPCHGNKIDSKCGVLAKDYIQKLFHAAESHLKRSLSECLRHNNVLVRTPDEGKGSHSLNARYLESLYPQSKYLNPNSCRERIAETTVSGLSPGPTKQSPLTSPAPSPDSAARSLGVPERHMLESKPPPPHKKQPKGTHSDSKGKEKKNQSSGHKALITAIVITAAVTFILASLLFICCTKLCKTRSQSGRNDERPLLSLSLSDYSKSSSYRSSGKGNSIKEGMSGQQTSSFNAAHSRKQSLDELFSLEDTTKSDSIFYKNNDQVYASALNPPPGQPHLKPPPGRAAPLPPEPPAYLKPGSVIANPSQGPTTLPVRPTSSEGSSAPAGPPPHSTLPSGTRPPPPPPMSLGKKPDAPPPPPPKGGAPPPRPPPPVPLGPKAPRPPPFGVKKQPNTSSVQGDGSEEDNDAPKTKLKPFFWDKVQANSDQTMVWNQLKAGSFQFNEEMIETLFGYAPAEKKRMEGKKNSLSQEQPKYIQIIDSKKGQNLSILLRALNVTKEEVCDALHEGNELPIELIQTLLKMAPTSDEELKLRLFSGDLSQLGPPERFLKSMVDIPFAFKRLEALLYMCTLQEEATVTKESFATLEVACNELRNSRLFLKLLEAVLKTGNRMNDGTFRGGAQAFKLDTLLKLSDVKGVDGKTTLLHFVVQEIIRSEGIRAARAVRESSSFSSIKTDDLLEEAPPDTEEHYRSLGLQVVSSLGSQLEHVRKAAVLDADTVTGTVSKLGSGLVKARNFLNMEMKSLEEESAFKDALKSFVENSEDEVRSLLEEEKRIMALVKSTGDYFHGKAGKDEGLRIFVIVRDFLVMLDKACKEVREASARAPKARKKEVSATPSSSDLHRTANLNLHRRLFPAIADRRMDSFSDESSSSDDEDMSR